ncbi:hypothetical protein [Streptomyces sp. AHA2]|uniref:hypothetical protein n=1 Tax=Streptomyces sp. AHA2 TaxID=3064526 RepID=UPI002FE376F2
MRRTLHALIVTAVAATGLAGFTPAFAEPAAEVRPADVEPGGTLTVSVRCDPTGGPPPESIEATSEAFAEGTASLRLVDGGGAAEHGAADRGAGPSGPGTAALASAGIAGEDDEALGEDAEVLGEDAEVLEEDAEALEEDAEALEGDAGLPGEDPEPPGEDLDLLGEDPEALGEDSETLGGGSEWMTEGGAGSGGKGTAPVYRGTAAIAPAEDFEGDPHSGGKDSAWTVDGTCPAAPGGHGKEWSATFTVRHGSGPHPPAHKPCPESSPRHEPGRTECGEAPVQRGVRAGDGGAFTDSVPALVAGGLLIAGALGAAAHRLRTRRSDPCR